MRFAAIEWMVGESFRGPRKNEKIGHMWRGPWLMYLPFPEGRRTLGTSQAKNLPRFRDAFESGK